MGKEAAVWARWWTRGEEFASSGGRERRGQEERISVGGITGLLLGLLTGPSSPLSLQY